jgi:hypothetical protein
MRDLFCSSELQYILGLLPHAEGGETMVYSVYDTRSDWLNIICVEANDFFY